MLLYLYLALAFSLMAFALFKIIHIAAVLARGGGVTTKGMITQPLYIGVALSLALYWFHQAGIFI